jgi:transcriptional regulator with XRE-family HTH domain
MLNLVAFGAMIREARTRRGWRPIDLALEMGWSGTAPIYRIERPGPDTPRPNPDTVNLLAQVLGLDYADRLTLLGFAGHLMDTEPLTAQEEAQLLAWVRPLMERAAEPTMLLDYRYRVLAPNAVYLRLFGVDAETVAAWRARELTAFDLVWDTSLVVGARLLNAERAGEVLMLRFKLDNRLRRHEAWYRAYPDRCAHHPGFVELWEQTEAFFARPVTEWELGRVVQEPIEIQEEGERPLRFDPAQRLVHAGYGLVSLLVLVPFDGATRRRMASIREQMAP